MPSGKTHNKINVSFTVVMLIPSAINSLSGDYRGFFCNAGILLSTFLLSPDLDTDGTEPDKNLGLFGKIWNIYSGIFRHRGISHWPIIGTLSRLLFVSIPFIFFSVFTGHWQNFYMLNKEWFQWILIGVTTGDNLHIASDIIVSWWKKITYDKEIRRIQQLIKKPGD